MPLHTHQMPTSLLLLRIQVSAASNLAAELPVTFCGRGGRLALRPAEQLGNITLLLGYGVLSWVLCTPQSAALLNAQRTGRKEV